MSPQRAFYLERQQKVKLFSRKKIEKESYFAAFVLELHEHPLLSACQLQGISTLLADTPEVPA